MKRKIEIIAIFLLALSAAFLLYRTLDDRMNLWQRDSHDSREEVLLPSPLQPVAIVINDGEQCSSLTDPNLLTTYFEQLRQPLIELLGSAGAAEIVSATEWKTALSGSGVLLDYGAVLPIDVLAGNAGGSLVDLEADALLISLEEEQVCMYLNGGDATCIFVQTALKTADLTALLSVPAGDAVVYASMYGDFATVLTPHSVIPLNTALNVSVVRTMLSDSDASYSPEQQERILKAFGFDVYTARSYLDASECRVFLDENGILRLGADGYVSFLADETGGSFLNGAQTLAEYAACASNILQEILTGLSGVPRYALYRVKTDESGVTLVYEALAEGYPMISETGNRTAASFHFKNGWLTAAEVVLFTVAEGSSEDATPAMSLQTLLSGMQGELSSGRLTPAYLQTTDGWQLSWCVLPVTSSEEAER